MNVQKFPDFKTRDLYLSGESYAGKYIPRLLALLSGKPDLAKDFKPILKGAAIGNGYLR